VERGVLPLRVVQMLRLRYNVPNLMCGGTAMTDYFHLSASADEIGAISSLGLAHLGDAVYELMVRSRLCLRGKATSRGLHKAAVAYVAAPAQAKAAGKLLPMLTKPEADVFRRGRNTRPHSVPRSAGREEYQTATAVEALFGWLYLRGELGRLNELFDLIMEE